MAASRAVQASPYWTPEALWSAAKGVAGGWGSNRLYPGMERRREDWSAHEGVALCQKVLDLQAAGSDAAEVNRFLLKQCSGSGHRSKAKKVRSLKGVLKKGLKLWKDRLLKVQVGKKGLRKKGAPLKRVCRTSESMGLQSSWRWSEGSLRGLQSCSEESLHDGTGERTGGRQDVRVQVTGR